jgi:hypothetical protein
MTVPLSAIHGDWTSDFSSLTRYKVLRKMGLLMGFRGYYNQFERHNPRLHEKFARFNVCTPKE